MFDRERTSVYEFLDLSELQPGMELGLSIWHNLLGRVAEPGVTLERRDVKFIQAFDLDGVIVTRTRKTWTFTDEAPSKLEERKNGAPVSSVPGLDQFLRRQDATRLLPSLRSFRDDRESETLDRSLVQDAREFREQSEQLKQRWNRTEPPRRDSLLEDLESIEHGNRPDLSAYDTRFLDAVKPLAKLHRKRLQIHDRLVRIFT